MVYAEIKVLSFLIHYKNADKDKIWAKFEDKIA